MTAVNTKFLAPLAVAGALLMSGCQQDPSIAAKVGEHDITTSDVALLADAMCSEREVLTKQGQQAAAPRSVVHQEALASLIAAEQARLLAQKHDIAVDQAGVNRVARDAEANIKGVPEAERPRLRELISGLLLEQDVMTKFAALTYQQQGQPAPQDPGTLIQAGRQAAASSGELAEVEVNPRFGAAGMEGIGAPEDVLSKPVGDKADKSAETDLTGMPANLRCG